MTYQWTSQFENSPVGSDLGAITAFEILRHKLAFRERFEREHFFDEGDTPECYHLPGMCSIVEVRDSALATNLVDGGLQYYQYLGRDNGTTMDAATAGSHLGLIAGTEDPTDHPQYFNRAGDKMTGVLIATDLSGIRGTLPAEPSNRTVLSKGMHIGADGGGNSKHPDDSFEPLESISIGMDKLKTSLVNTLTANISSGQAELRFDNEYAFGFWLIGGNPCTLYVCRTNYSDYIGCFKIKNGTDGVRTFEYLKMDAS